MRPVKNDEHERILHLYRVDRVPVRELARAVGRSSRTIYEVVRADGELRGHARVDADRVARRYVEGTPVKHIAVEHHCSDSHVSYLARISGCRMRGRGNRNHSADLRLAWDF